jgi:hypothetical protein
MCSKFQEVIGIAKLKSEPSLFNIKENKDLVAGGIVDIVSIEGADAVVVEPISKKLMTVKKSLFQSYFKCFILGGVIVPPTATCLTERIAYRNKVLAYNKNYGEASNFIVIVKSLEKGFFYDDFLFKS